MTDRSFSWLAYPIVLILLAALTFALILLGSAWGLGDRALYLLAIPIALAIAYLAWYRTLPYTPPAAPAPPTGPVLEEPFEDPVEEADRLGAVEDETKVPEASTEGGGTDAPSTGPTTPSRPQ
jgi:hypothetical protein